MLGLEIVCGSIDCGFYTLGICSLCCHKIVMRIKLNSQINIKFLCKKSHSENLASAFEIECGYSYVLISIHFIL